MLLKQSNGGKAGGTGTPAALRVVQSDSAQSEHRNWRSTSLAQAGDFLGRSASRTSFFEDRREESQICTLRRGLRNLLRRVASDGDQCAFAMNCRLTEDRSNLRRGCIVGRQMNAIGARRQSNVGAGVHKQRGSIFSACLLGVADDAHRFAGQRLQFAGVQVLFSKLNVIDSGGGGIRDFAEQTSASRSLIPRKPAAIRDVVKKHSPAIRPAESTASSGQSPAGLPVLFLFSANHPDDARSDHRAEKRTHPRAYPRT